MKTLKRFYLPLLLFVIALEVLYSIGRTMGYYFYTDDYALIYQLQNNTSYGWPYQHLTTIFSIPFKFFGINPQGYFVLGVVTYYLSTITNYFFVFFLTKNRLIAFLSALILGTAYIGLDQFTLIISTVNNINNLNICLTLILFILWLDRKKLRYYFGALFLFWFSIFLLPTRAFPLVLFIPIIGIVLTIKLNKSLLNVRSLSKLIIALVPFILVAYLNGIFSYGVNTASGSILPGIYSNKVLEFLNFESIQGVLAILGSFVLPELNSIENGHYLVGLLFFILVFMSALIAIKDNQRLGKSLLIMLFMTIAGYIGYYLLLPTFNSNGVVNRYFSTSYLAYSALFPIVFYLISKKMNFAFKLNYSIVLIPLVLILVMISYTTNLARNYEENILKGRSVPAREFFKNLDSFIPHITNKNIFYFDVSDVYPSPSKYGSIVLGAVMPKEVVLASHYGVNINSVKIASTFNELLKFTKNRDSKTNFYTFYYDEKGLHRTDDELFTLLQNGNNQQIDSEKIVYKLTNQIPKLNVSVDNFPSLVPSKIKFKLNVNSISPSEFNFPFYNTKSDKKEIQDFFEKIPDKKIIFEYLASREQYFEKVKAEVSSSHASGQNNKELLIDKKSNTSWISFESDWEARIKPWVKLDLGDERKISKVILTESQGRLPDQLKISTSLDKKTWKEVKIKRDRRILSDKVLDILTFDPVNAKYLIIEINSTENNITPGLAEVEVVEEKFKQIDPLVADRILQNPFEYIKNSQELMETYDFLKSNNKMKIKTKTNKDENEENIYILEIPVKIDQGIQDYTVFLDPRGTRLETISWEFNFPVNVVVSDVELSNRKLDDLYAN